MLRVLLFLIAAGVAVAISWWIAALPGAVTVQFGQTTAEASVPVVILVVALAFLAFYILLRLFFGLIHLPRRTRAWQSVRRRRLGDQAVTRTLLALASGESTEARREATRARRLLGDTPQTLLLAAESAQRAGRDGEAESAFRQLSERPDAAFLGLRGLLRQAVEREDWAQAAELARRAELAHPGSGWLRAERAQLAMRAGDWKEALALAGPDAPEAALATAAAEAESDPAAALRLAQRAFKADPALAPAALAYARRLREAGRESRAQEVILRAWETRPHPDLGTFAVAATEDRLARMPIAEKLARANPDHPESHFLLARTALDAGLTGEAHRHADAALAAGLNQRRLWTLMADLAEAEGGDSEAARTAQRDAFRKAALADPDPTWRCEACGAEHHEWHPVCPNCHTAGRLAWISSPRAVALG